MNSKFLTIVCVLVSVMSCKKNKKAEFQLSGTVTDFVNNTAISGVTIKFYKNESSSGYYNNNYELAGETISGSDGTYSFTVPASNVIQYKLTAEKVNYDPKEMEINPDDIELGENNIYDFSTAGYSYLNLNIRNVNPINNDDNLVFSVTNTDLSCQACCQIPVLNFSGMNVDTTIECNVYSGYFRCSTIKTKNNITIEELDSIYCPLGDTADLNYTY